MAGDIAGSIPAGAEAAVNSRTPYEADGTDAVELV